MIQKLKVTFLLVTVLAASSCSELEDAVDRNLSTNQITYKVETLNEWNKVESSAKQARTRAAMPADGDVVKRVNGWSGPLYLHALEEPGIHIRDYKDRPVNKQGQLLADENTGRIIATRGSKVTDASLTDFGINVKRVSSDNSAETFIDNEEVKTAVGSKYKTSDDHFWPSDNTSLSFYGYYPYNSGNYSSYISVKNSGTAPVVTYKSTAGITSATATQVKAQPDLCVAVKTGETRPSTSATPDAVNMTFDHALTAITFAVGSDMVPGTFKSITISGVYLEGDYTYDSGWSTANKPTGSITLNLGTDGNGIKRSSKEAVALTGNDSTLLMVPQKVPSDATISMVFDDGKSVNTFTANIGGTEWTAGSTIIYKLSTKAVNNMTLGTITFPTTWTAAGYPKTAYDSGESMGLYSVDDLGNLRAQNVKITYNGKSWTPATFVRFSPAFKYFVYYPYNASMSSSSVTSNAATAEQFFGKYATSFQVAANQSAKTDLEKNDLQVGMGTLDGTGSSVEFSSMEHSMGIVNLTLGSKTVPSTRVFKPGSTTQKLFDRAPTTSITATSNFSASISSKSTSSYKKATGIYLLIGKPLSTVTFASNSSEKYKWASNLTYTFSQNKGEIKTVTPSREYDNAGWGFDYTGAVQTFTASTAGIYKLEVWGASAGAPLWNGVVDKNRVLGGGYSNGKISLSSSNKLYISVGGKGEDGKYQKDNAGGWNGGGKGIWDHNDDESLGGGGGCTSIQISLISDGQLYQYKNNKDKVLIVAGGSGGFGMDYLNTKNICYGGGTEAGGGYIVNDGSYERIETLSPANQSSGYAFGKGQDANYNGHFNPESPGGGGGWYGGFAPIDQIDASVGNAGGGSGYVNTSKLTEASTIAGNTSFTSPSGETEIGHIDNGYAIITQLSY